MVTSGVAEVLGSNSANILVTLSQLRQIGTKIQASEAGDYRLLHDLQ